MTAPIETDKAKINVTYPYKSKLPEQFCQKMPPWNNHHGCSLKLGHTGPHEAWQLHLRLNRWYSDCTSIDVKY